MTRLSLCALFHFTAVALANPPLTGQPPSPEHLALARDYHAANGGQALLVMHAGKIIFEHYGNGGAKDRAQMLASGSKSFVGVAAMAAVADGLLTLDAPVSELLTEWKDDPAKSTITHRQLLTLTSGLTPGERGAATSTPGWKELLSKPMSAKPGEKFEYGAYHLNVFAEALERKLLAAQKETFESYLQRRILDPLGVKVEWRLRCQDGHPQVGSGAYMAAGDWAKFGELMRLDGKWEDKQIVPSEKLAECLRGTPQNPAYGLTWWLREPVPAAIARGIPILQRDMGDIVQSDWVPDDLYLAAGAGKQRLYVIPSLQLVVVRQGNLRAGMSFGDAEFLSRLLRGEASKGTNAAAPQRGATRDREALRERLEKLRVRRGAPSATAPAPDSTK